MDAALVDEKLTAAKVKRKRNRVFSFVFFVGLAVERSRWFPWKWWPSRVISTISKISRLAKVWVDPMVIFMGFSGDSMGISWEMAKEFFFGVSQQ